MYTVMTWDETGMVPIIHSVHDEASAAHYALERMEDVCERICRWTSDPAQRGECLAWITMFADTPAASFIGGLRPDPTIRPAATPEEDDEPIQIDEAVLRAEEDYWRAVEALDLAGDAAGRSADRLRAASLHHARCIVHVEATRRALEEARLSDTVRAVSWAGEV